MSEQMLRAYNISVDFSGLRALDQVTLEVESGEIVGLIGPNGSGKTTLVNVLTGHVRPMAGAVTCSDIDITHMTPRNIALQGISRTFQIVRLFSNLTVSENIEAAAISHGCSRRSARRKAGQLLEKFGLERVRDQFANTLSYGDERRVEIARALAGDPKFLLLDEPAAGMNETESESLLELLACLPSEQKLGMLIIDHDMGLMMRLSHRLHVLASGKTIGEGSVEYVRKLPQVIEAYLGSDGNGR
ncbi:MAG: ABC transporter ATP-binding protein [Deltaproteobacteria bacterium]|nr:ABC transporter ATP-binding protein [Deltaproteobacteria bacterium]